MDFGEQGQRVSENYLNGAVSSVQAVMAHEGSEWCEDCDEEIPYERRRAVPWATRCVVCQNRFERLGGR